MRRLFHVLACVAILLAGAAMAQAPAQAPAALPPVDDIIAKNIEAHGGLANMKAIQSLRFTGRMTVGPGVEAPLTVELKRPKRMRMEFTIQGMTGIQALDGDTGWQVMPFMGKKDAEPMSPDDQKDAEDRADFDGFLVDYRAKGHTVELVGKESVEGADCYKLKVTKKNGDVWYLYIDADSYLAIRVDTKRPVRGTEMEIEASIGDYKEVGGIMWPHVMEGGPKGSPMRQKIIIEKVEINPELDDARFVMPPPAPKPAETKPPEEKPKPPRAP